MRAFPSVGLPCMEGMHRNEVLKLGLMVNYCNVQSRSVLLTMESQTSATYNSMRT